MKLKSNGTKNVILFIGYKQSASVALPVYLTMPSGGSLMLEAQITSNQIHT